jgi:predicted DNA-binding protein (MmcQ/YjbR family)
MDADRARTFLLKLPHVVETMQWGDNMVFWAGDKAIGGKMFALVNLDKPPADERLYRIASYAAGPERFSELIEREGVFPAPYAARNFWVAVQRWGALRDVEWESELRAAHAIILAKLPKRTRDVLAMPERERAKVIAARKKLLATQAAKKAKAKKKRAR